MSALPWILGGGAGALAAYWWRHRDDREAAPPVPIAPARVEVLPGRWVWPVGVWSGRRPQISDGFTSKRRDAQGATIQHGGVDIMYPRVPGDAWRAGSPNGARGFVMPDQRAALAASDGVVWFAAQTPRGWSVVIDHAPRKLSTYYTHLSSLLVSAKQPIAAGAPIGVIGADPLDGAHLMHLHFELRRGGYADRVDPAPYMAAWEYLRDPGEPRNRSAHHRRR